MHEQQLSKEAKLADCEVSRACGLKALHAGDADTYMSSLNHRDIVRAISDGEKDALEVLLD